MIESCSGAKSRRFQTSVPDEERQPDYCTSITLETRDGERADNRCARVHAFWTGELFERGFEARVRLADAIGILNDRLAVSKKTGDRDRKSTRLNSSHV